VKSAKCQTVIQLHAAVCHIQRGHGNGAFLREVSPEKSENYKLFHTRATVRPALHRELLSHQKNSAAWLHPSIVALRN
jgi:hypothetical protein